ncbi:MASE1 domain-containing protein [Burkholderia sp. BCC0405]|uniref:MASE1 domain-containing protein n=1 Tax=Burkholderia sp. BCC0405 TaxID=2676298 RepID=UPI00158E8128|nr:MASE1 domain-containing protein [Burkholderia sp. BCC0405]
MSIRKASLPHITYWLCIYLATGVLSGQFNVNSDAHAPYVWLPAGVSLAAILLSHASSSIVLAIAFGLLQSVLSHMGGRDIPAALVLGALAGIAPLIAVAIVRRLRLHLQGLHLFWAVVVAALVSAVLLGGGGSLYFAIVKGAPFFPSFREWTAAIFVGVCITLPLLVVWAQLRPKRSVKRNGYRDVIGYVSFVTMVAVTWWLFDNSTAQWLDEVGVTYPLYLPIFFVVVVAIVGGARGGTLAVSALTLICLGYTSNGYGPFSAPSAPISLSLLQAQLYVGVLALLVLIVHALRSAEAQALAQADRWRTDLELALEGGGLIAYTVDASTQQVQWRGDLSGMTGYSNESLSTVDRVISHVHPDDRVRLRARWTTTEISDSTTPAHLPIRLASLFVLEGWIELVDIGSSLSDGNEQVAFVAGVWQHPPLPAGRA